MYIMYIYSLEDPRWGSFTESFSSEEVTCPNKTLFLLSLEERPLRLSSELDDEDPIRWTAGIEMSPKI